MTKKAIIQNLKTARSMYITHKEKNTPYIGYWGSQCLKYRKLLEAYYV